jgi:putative FmdB family regulatory protein
MPIYEFACQRCGHEFETLTRASVEPECPSCHSHDLAKKLSVFATASSAEGRVPETAAAGPCGTCGHPGGPGACAFDD